MRNMSIIFSASSSSEFSCIVSTKLFVQERDFIWLFYRPMALIYKKMNEQKIRNWSRKHFWWWQLINCCWPYIMSDLDVGRWLESKQRKFNCVLIKVSFGIERQGLSNAFSWVIAVILQILHRCQNCTKITSKRIIWIFALKIFSTSFGKEFSKKIVKLTEFVKICLW